MATLLQLPLQFAVIVDLAVEDDLNRIVLVADRLVATGKIDDRQPPMGEANARTGPNPFGVRTASARSRLPFCAVARFRPAGARLSKLFQRCRT